MRTAKLCAPQGRTVRVTPICLNKAVGLYCPEHDHTDIPAHDNQSYAKRHQHSCIASGSGESLLVARTGISTMQCRHAPRATTNRLMQRGCISERTEMMFLSLIHKRQAETVSLQTPVPCKLCLIKAFRRGINPHLSLSLAMLQFCLGAYLFSPGGFTAKNISGLSLAKMGGGRTPYGISQVCSYHMPFTCLHFLTMV